MCINLIWIDIPYFHKLERAAHSKTVPSLPDCDLTNSTKQGSGSCLLAKDTLLSDGTLALIGVFNGNPSQPYST